MQRILLYVGLLVGSFFIPRAFVILCILISGSRELGMYIGINYGLLLTWLIFPILYWRPFTKLKVVTTVAVSLGAFFLAPIAKQFGLEIPKDDYGIYRFTLSFSLVSILLYELATRFVVIENNDPPAA